MSITVTGEPEIIIVAGQIGSGRTVLLNKLLMEYAEKGDLIMGTRNYPQEGLGEGQEVVFDQEITDQNTINIFYNCNADVLFFDDFRIDYSSDIELVFPHKSGHKIFCVLYAKGNTPEEMKNNALTNYELLVGKANLSGIKKVVVTAYKMNVDTKKVFVATEFLIN